MTLAENHYSRGYQAQANSEMLVINTNDTVTVGQRPDKETAKSHTTGTADSLLGYHAQLWILKGHGKTAFLQLKATRLMRDWGNAIRKISECR